MRKIDNKNISIFSIVNKMAEIKKSKLIFAELQSYPLPSEVIRNGTFIPYQRTNTTFDDLIRLNLEEIIPNIPLGLHHGHSNEDIEEWIKKGVELGAGSILLTSIDHDGTQKGFDAKLCSKIYEICEAPLVISGGMGEIEDIISICEKYEINGLAAGTIFHYESLKINKVIDFATFLKEKEK